MILKIVSWLFAGSSLTAVAFGSERPLDCARPYEKSLVCSPVDHQSNDSLAEQLVDELVVCTLCKYDAPEMKLRPVKGGDSKPMKILIEPKTGATTFVSTDREYQYKLTKKVLPPSIFANSEMEVKSLLDDTKGVTYRRLMHCEFVQHP